MRKILFPSRTMVIFIGLLFTLSLGGSAFAQTLTIMHTNDMHSHLLGFGPNGEYTPIKTGDNDPTLGGMARIAGKINDIRASRDPAPTLLVDAGDFMMGSAFVFLGGAAELQIMDTIGYDVATLGNHEFDWTSAGTAAILSQMPSSPRGFPIVASNLIFDAVDPGDDALKALYDAGVIQDTYIKKVDGLNVGFFGLVGENAASVSPLAYPVTFQDPFIAAAAAVADLQSAGVDLIVCLSHSGLDEDSALALSVSGIDVIISGHTHEKSDTGPIEVGGTLIVQAGSYTRYLGVLDLDLSLGTHQYSLVPIDDCIESEDPSGCVSADSGVDTLVNGLITGPGGVNDALASQGYTNTFNQVIAETDFDLNAVDGEENGLGNLVADAIRWMVDLHETSETVDVAIESNGVIRDNIQAGTILNNNIRFSDAFRALPLGLGLDGNVGYPVLSFYLAGSDIKKALELIVLAFPIMGGDYWLNVSGLRYQYLPGGIPLLSVLKVEIGDEESGYTKMDPYALYKVALNYYVAQFIDGVPALVDSLIGIPGIGNALKIVPRDADGNALEDTLGEDYLAASRVDIDPLTDGIQELKEWKGFMDYLATFDDPDEDGTPNIPSRYNELLGLEGRITTADCVIATAAYGSSLEPHVDILRIFRDRVLNKTEWGRDFVKFYYRHGRAPAAWIEEHPWAKAPVRVLLLPLIGMAKFILWIL